jgi:molecular chaperone Hsp31 and glyoxalase 3
MNFIRKILGTAPKPTADGAFAPSWLAMKMATSSTTDYDGTKYVKPYKGEKNRILMLCTQERNMTMANGNKFSTGNHPVEMALPMLHLINAGFEIEVFTPTGDSAKIEMWAMPDQDENVKKLFNDFDAALNVPNSLADFVANKMKDETSYAGIFIPGGHGAMLGLPENEDVGKLLRWADEQNLYTITLCHGPGVLMAAKEDDNFIYDGYKIALFPDSVDKQTPKIGYLPGPMPFLLGEKLTAMGLNIVNKKADDTCHIDRRLITGASPQASNNLGKLAAKTLLENL